MKSGFLSHKSNNFSLLSFFIYISPWIQELLFGRSRCINDGWAAVSLSSWGVHVLHLENILVGSNLMPSTSKQSEWGVTYSVPEDVIVRKLPSQISFSNPCCPSAVPNPVVISTIWNFKIQRILVKKYRIPNRNSKFQNTLNSCQKFFQRNRPLKWIWLDLATNIVIAFPWRDRNTWAIRLGIFS